MTKTRIAAAAIAAATALGTAGVTLASPAINLANGEKAAPQTETSATPVYHHRYGYYPGYYYPRYYYRPYYRPYYYQPYYGYYGYPGYYDYGPRFRFGINIR